MTCHLLSHIFSSIHIKEHLQDMNSTENSTCKAASKYNYNCSSCVGHLPSGYCIHSAGDHCRALLFQSQTQFAVLTDQFQCKLKSGYTSMQQGMPKTSALLPLTRLATENIFQS
eukprot:c49427_g1_i1 orf=442-783(-)